MISAAKYKTHREPCPAKPRFLQSIQEASFGQTRRALLADWFDHAAEVLAGENMEVEVGNFLVAVPALIGEDAAARLGDAELRRYRADRAHEADEFRIARLFGEFDVGYVGPFRDHKHMDRRLRGDVAKGERVVVFINFIAGNLTPEDLRKDVLIVIGHHLVIPSRILFIDAGNAEPVRDDGPDIFRPDTFVGP